MLKFTAIITAIGLGGFVMASLIGMNAVSEIIFNVAAVSLVVGPLIFFAYVVIGLCLEYISVNRRPEAAFVTPGPLREVPASPVWRAAYVEGPPEGLRRERKGPLGRSSGRAHTI